MIHTTQECRIGDNVELMTREPAPRKCPKCDGVRNKIHALECDIAVCDSCGHRENIEYGGR